MKGHKASSICRSTATLPGDEFPCGEGASIPPGKREETDRKYQKCCKCDDDYYLSGTECLPRTCAAAKLDRDTGEPIPFSCGQSEDSCMVFNPDAGDLKYSKAMGKLNIDTCCMIRNEALYFKVVVDGERLLSNGCEERTCTFNDRDGGEFPCGANGGQMRLLARLSKRFNPDFPTCCKCKEGYAPVQGDTTLAKGTLGFRFSLQVAGIVAEGGQREQPSKSEYSLLGSQQPNVCRLASDSNGICNK